MHFELCMQIDIAYCTFPKTQKAVLEMIDLDLEVDVSAIAAEGLVLETVEIDWDGNYTTVLFQIVELEFDIRYLEIVVFVLVCSLIDIVFKDKYL